MYNAKLICDSISETGKRLTTFEITFPRIVLAEFNTHRMFSRNSASSRAIPFKKQLERVLENPFVPERFPINGKGMQPNSYIYDNSDVYKEAENNWLNARDSAIKMAESLYNCLDNFKDSEHPEVKIHKQIANRLLEPFMWHTVIVTATEFDNFFKLRTNENAQYEIRRIADLMYEAYHAFDKDGISSDVQFRKTVYPDNEPSWKAIRPKELKVGEWHLPFIYDEDWKMAEELILREIVSDETLNLFKYVNINDITKPDTLELLKAVSVARCARVSYLTHDGKRDIKKDLELFERLRTSGHWSPFEHVATPFFRDAGTEYKGSYDEITDDIQFHTQRYMNRRSGNFIGWKQFRKEFQDENCSYFRKE